MSVPDEAVEIKSSVKENPGFTRRCWLGSACLAQAGAVGCGDALFPLSPTHGEGEMRFSLFEAVLRDLTIISAISPFFEGEVPGSACAAFASASIASAPGG